MQVWSMTKENLEDTADAVKSVVLDALVDEGIMSEKDAERWCATHTILFRKKSIFATFTDLFKKSPEATGMNILVVKGVTGRSQANKVVPKPVVELNEGSGRSLLVGLMGKINGRLNREAYKPITGLFR